MDMPIPNKVINLAQFNQEKSSNGLHLDVIKEENSAS